MHEKKNIISNDLQNSKLSTILEKSNQCDSSENHGKSDSHCLNCHFGHHSMIVGSYVHATLSHDEIVYPYSFSSVYSYKHHLDIFRPPIV